MTPKPASDSSLERIERAKEGRSRGADENIKKPRITPTATLWASRQSKSPKYSVRKFIDSLTAIVRDRAFHQWENADCAQL